MQRVEEERGEREMVDSKSKEEEDEKEWEGDEGRVWEWVIQGFVSSLPPWLMFNEDDELGFGERFKEMKRG